MLPGVTVEAVQPGADRKSAVGRRPTARASTASSTCGPVAYVVTFTLPGFTTVKREGLELTGSFTATVNADMRVGAVEETITVSGEAPTVDVQSTARQRVIDSATMDALPSGRNQFTLGVLIPGVTLAQGGNAGQDVGGAKGPDTLALLDPRQPHVGSKGDAERRAAQLDGGRRMGQRLDHQPDRHPGNHHRHVGRLGRAVHRRRPHQPDSP